MKKRSLFLGLLLSCLSISADGFKNPETAEEALSYYKDSQTRFVELLFSDIHGTLKSLTFPFHKVAGAIEKGAYFDGSSIAGCTNINESDLLAKVDLSGFFLSPWTKQMSTGYLFCDMYTSPTEKYQDSPRTILKKAMKKAEDAGYNINVGLELEFFIFKKDNNGDLVPVDSSGYCDALPTTELETFKSALLNGLFLAGVDIEKAHHEVAPGQYEIVLRYQNPLRIADSLLLTKHITQRIAQHFDGYYVSFMPKPITGVNGSGMHVHCSLWDIKENKNAFYDAEKPGFLSETAHYFIGGNVAHLQEMTLLLNSSVNSYKRLVPGYEAPVYLSWGFKNRSTAIRIPETSTDELIETNGAPTRMEFRSADPSSNPYLLFAGIINAGLDGIANKTAAPQHIEHNLYRSTKEECEELNIKIIPSSLGESVALFKNSDLMKQSLGESLHKKLVSIKEKEWDDYSETEKHDPFTVSQWEKRYHRLKS